MKVVIGENGRAKTHQGEFPIEVTCKCGGVARMAFVAHEVECEPSFVYSLHDNGGKGDYWPHDACSVAVYFCKECFEAVTKFNQA